MARSGRAQRHLSERPAPHFLLPPLGCSCSCPPNEGARTVFLSCRLAGPRREWRSDSSENTRNALQTKSCNGPPGGDLPGLTAENLWHSQLTGKEPSTVSLPRQTTEGEKLRPTQEGGQMRPSGQGHGAPRRRSFPAEEQKHESEGPTMKPEPAAHPGVSPAALGRDRPTASVRGFGEVTAV